MCERKLSVCIIVKNEEENLKKCLLALLAFPFEIVVVDTGSADRTVEVAQSLDVFAVFVGVSIHFVDNQYDRNPIGFGGSQKTVDEGGAGLRVVYRDDQ